MTKLKLKPSAVQPSRPDTADIEADEKKLAELKQRIDLSTFWEGFYYGWLMLSLISGIAGMALHDFFVALCVLCALYAVVSLFFLKRKLKVLRREVQFYNEDIVHMRGG